MKLNKKINITITLTIVVIIVLIEPYLRSHKNLLNLKDGRAKTSTHYYGGLIKTEKEIKVISRGKLNLHYMASLYMIIPKDETSWSDIREFNDTYKRWDLAGELAFDIHKNKTLTESEKSKYMNDLFSGWKNNNDDLVLGVIKELNKN